MGEVTKITAEPVKEPVKKELPALAGLVSPKQLAATVAIEAQGRAVEVVVAKMAAMALPRDEHAILSELLERCTDEVFADEAIYAKPAGSKNIGGKWVPQFIEGPSIAMLTEIARVWGNLKLVTRVFPPEKSSTDILVRKMDLQENVEWEATYAVPHKRWKAPEYSNGKIVKAGEVIEVVEPDKIRLLVLSEQSKQVRNIIRRGVPANILKQCMLACENTNLLADKTLAKDYKKAVETFKERFGISEAQICGFLEIKKASDLQPEHVRKMRVLYQSIKEGQVDPSELFEGATRQPKKEREEEKPAPEPTALEKAKEVKKEAEKKVEEKAKAEKEKPAPEPKKEEPEPQEEDEEEPTEDDDDDEGEVDEDQEEESEEEEEENEPEPEAKEEEKPAPPAKRRGSRF